MYISEKAPAKINLTLEVKKERQDGYHDLISIMTTIDLADRIDFELNEDSPKIEFYSEKLISKRNIRKNLVYQTARLLQHQFQVKQGAKIKIEKHIPVSAGLGGGSSDAAAALRGLNRLWGLNLTVQEMKELGSQIGSDVPFCVHNATALVRGRGEHLFRLPKPPCCWVILVKPFCRISTGDVFRNFLLKPNYERPDHQAVVEAIHCGDYKKMANNLSNMLEEVTIEMTKEVVLLKNRMAQLDVEGIVMSGSGPTVYGLVKTEAKVKRIINGLRGYGQKVYAVRMLG
ncbi:MAG: hypothetical protein RLZ12_862 [Bacillota bacterium]